MTQTITWTLNTESTPEIGKNVLTYSSFWGLAICARINEEDFTTVGDSKNQTKFYTPYYWAELPLPKLP